MNYRQIVAEAWEFTQKNKKFIIWYAVIPAFLSTSVGIMYILYQYYAFLASPLFENWSSSFLSVAFRFIFDYLRANPAFINPLIITAIIIGILYFLLPVLCEGALIQIIARIKNGQNVRIRHGLRYGLLSFLPLFEYKLLIRTFSITSIFAILATALRNFGLSVLNVLLPIFIVAMIAGFILTVFFTYSEFFIIIDDNKVFESISKSTKLVVTHLEETVLLSILMLIIGVRIIVQILFVFLVPALIFITIYAFSAANLPGFAIFFAAIIGFIGLIIAAYLNGVIQVFAISVWTFTFLKLTTDGLLTARGEVISPEPLKGLQDAEQPEEEG